MSTQPDVVLARWQHSPTQAGTTTVLPDGCCDLILRVDAAVRAHWMVSPLAQHAYDVAGQAGERWVGFRLQPGATIDAQALLRAVRRLGAEVEDARILAAIERHARLDGRTQEALAALAQSRSVGSAARTLGVGERSLERLALAATGQPPRYWRTLARVRRAAQALAGPAPLAAVAADHGFADQAHFSRECARWLGRTPSRLRADPAVLAVALASGYA